MTPSFVHLRTHTEFSISDGLLTIESLIKNTVSLGSPAVAITDKNSLYGLVKFQKKAFSNGVKPIFGADLLWFDDEDGDHKFPYIITLLAKNQEGYKNLLKLISEAYQRGQFPNGASVLFSWIKKYSDGLIVLSGAKDGDIGVAIKNKKYDVATNRLNKWKSIFCDRFYIDVQRTSHADHIYTNEAVSLARETDTPIVATNSCCFLKREDYEAHEVRVCINDARILDDKKRPRLDTDEQYLKSSAEMFELFSDIPEAIKNSVVIASRCNVEIELGNYYLPDYPIPDSQSQDEYFRSISRKGLEKRLIEISYKNKKNFALIKKEYIERLEFELDTIIQMGFAGYFLIVMDFIKWAKTNSIPVGPGRGSGAGSLVAYSLEITDLDPITYDLLFERFLNPERVSMPDFDVDFCMEKRDRVIQYVANTYGKEAVGQIITFNTMAARAVVRDVARAQGKSYGLADKLSKMIPFEVGMTLDKAFEQEKTIRDFLRHDSDAQEIWDMAIQLEGITRSVGRHAGGVVISPSKLTDFSPLYCDDSSEGLVTQYDKNDVEEAGLIKFDFLGLRTLTIIDWALSILNSSRKDSDQTIININNIPLDDEKVFELLQQADTTAVFQLESRGMKELIKRLSPSSFEEIIALVALFRPGPLQSGMVDDFINRKHGRAQLSYPHPKYQHDNLKQILEPTYGIILYQEQVMQIAQVMGGYSLGEADLLRRAMGKKKPEEMSRQGEIFINGAVKKGYDEDLARNIFDLMEKFAGYGFNKSHSAAYALVSYQTAWLKTHYPSPFMAAVLSSELQNTDKIITLLNECNHIGVKFMTPDINSSNFYFSVNEDDVVVYGLGAIKGLGEGPAETILSARKNKPFTDLFDFCARIDSKKLNKRALEALIKSGSFDCLGKPRWVLLAALPEAMKAAEQKNNNLSQGMVDLFGEMEEINSDDIYNKYLSVKPWNLQKILEFEKESLGLYLSGHPLDVYEHDVKNIISSNIKKLKISDKIQKIAGMISNIRIMRNKKGETIAFLSINDHDSQLDVSVFSDVFDRSREILNKGATVFVEGEIRRDDYNGGISMLAKNIYDVAEARQRYSKKLLVEIYKDSFSKDVIKSIQAIITDQSHHENNKNCRLCIRYIGHEASTDINLGDEWKLYPSDKLVGKLKDLCGEDKVTFLYDEGK